MMVKRLSGKGIILLHLGISVKQNVASDTNSKGRLGARFHYYLVAPEQLTTN